MYKYDHPTAVGVEPARSAAGTPGFYRNGNPALGVPASVLDADHLNAMQNELLNVLDEAGVAPDKGDDTQLYAAMVAIATAVAGAAAGFVGEIRMLGHDTIPAGWAECDGSTISRATYASYYAAVGDRWGAGNGTTTVTLPNFHDRFPVGANGTTRDVGDYTASNVGAHTHGAGFIDPEGRSDAGSNMIVPANTGGLAGFTTASSGAGDTEPKSGAVLYIIKIA